METINSMASTAAKVIWGENNTTNDNTTTTTSADTTTTGTETTTSEIQKPITETTANPAANANKMSTETHGQEPVSGKLGDASKGEPFDAGNIETAQSETSGTETAGVTGTPQTHTPTTKTSGLTDSQTKTPTTETSGVTGTQNKAPTTETVGETTGAKGPTSEQPSTAGDHGGFKAAQADIRDPETSATTDPKIEAERKNVDDTGALDEGDNPAKADGPGPKPIEEVARERGGDAANTGEKKTDATDDDPEGLHGHSESKGTGEQYVKTSGLKADGGDFDATKPGAGREADRLMEEKGIQTPAAAAAAAKKPDSEDASPDSPDSKKEKTSLKDKIKAKLHKN